MPDVAAHVASPHGFIGDDADELPTVFFLTSAAIPPRVERGPGSQLVI